MIPLRVRQTLRKTQLTLRNKRFSNYLTVLSALLQDYRESEALRAFAGSLRARDFEKLYQAADSLSEQKYPDATQHFVANQFALLVKKYPWDSSLVGLDPEGKALESFASSEKRVRRINQKFSFLQVHHPSRDRFLKQVGAARFWIRSVIGSSPCYSSIFDKCDFGPGASLGVHGNATSFARKYANESWTVTPGALHHGFAAICANYHLFEALCPRGSNGMVCYDMEKAFTAYLSRIKVVDHNKISFVPKTAKTHRSIAVEPLLNGFVQKGIDQELRKKLLRFGIDLADQSKNQEFARQGSLDDSDDGFVTIDLKSASDSISRELVRHLLPDDWFRLLDRTRSHAYELNGSINRFEKFCSMGNGFCFPLETLIFASAAHAVGAGRPGIDFLVYGDDIIVRKRYATGLLSLLKHFGFKINPDKTFLEGPFRESCGADWFGGQDVRPFTLDFQLEDLTSFFKFLNLTRSSIRRETFFKSVRSRVLDMIPDEFQFFRPLKGEVDTGIDSSGDEHLFASSVQTLPREGRFSWLELVQVPIVDYDGLVLVHDKPWLISVALRGASPVGSGRFGFLPKLTLRRQVKTKVVRKSYASTSNWLPGPVGFLRVADGFYKKA